MQRSLPDALADVPGGWTTDNVSIAGRNFRLTFPARPDALLDDPAVEVAHARDGYMPYWGYIWPSAWDMAAEVLRGQWTGPRDVLELGSGVGVVGLAGLAAGLNVTFTDYDEQSVALSLHNANQNGWTDAEGIVLDWRRPPSRRFPIVFACELIYETRNHEPVLGALDAMLADDGVCYLADPGRTQAPAFFALAKQRGYTWGQRVLPPEPFPGRSPSLQTNLWLLRKSN
jgi:predicted nicotinamide N-methyase